MKVSEAAERSGEGAAITLAELLGALSHALDMTEGQPPGHCARAAWVGAHVGRRLGLGDDALVNLHYAILLKDLGCSSNAARICGIYLADDLAFKRDFKRVSERLHHVLGFVFTHTGVGAPLTQRFSSVVNILRNGPEIAMEMIETRCQRGAEIASTLRFPSEVSQAIASLDEHWNGTGKPARLVGPDIPLHARIALLAQVVDVFHATGGRDAACREVARRSGSWFDPDVARAFLDVASGNEFWAGFAAEPSVKLPMGSGVVRHLVDDEYLDDVAVAFAGIVDAKSPYTHGHSSRVATYADAIAREMGMGSGRRRWIRRAGLLHDIGKLGVSNAILDKPAKLDDDEWVAMRLHATYSETILSRLTAFGDVAKVGGRHHERIDGKGYPNALGGDDLDVEVRLMSVADVFDALTADRPYRAAMPVAKALDVMRADVGTAFDPDCLAALCRASDAEEGGLPIASVDGDGDTEPDAMAA